MTIPQITEENFTAALEQAVAERGEDWSYPEKVYVDTEQTFPRVEDNNWHNSRGSCRYFQRDQTECPACLFGAALAILGVTNEDLVGLDLEYQGITSVLTELGAPDSVIYPASLAQQAQDNGSTWGECLEIYRTGLQRYHEVRRP